MKRKIKKWYIVGGLLAVALVALAEIAANDWWAIHYARYLTGADNVYINEAASLSFKPPAPNAPSPTAHPSTSLAAPVAQH